MAIERSIAIQSAHGRRWLDVSIRTCERSTLLRLHPLGHLVGDGLQVFFLSETGRLARF
jgi:hypothetical protein